MKRVPSRETTDRNAAATGGRGGTRCYWSPPDLPADTAAKRALDRLLPRSGAPAAVYWSVVIALLILAPQLPVQVSLVVDGLAALVAAAWCGANFWRCRHAHCLITSTGWTVLALLEFIADGLGLVAIAGYWQLAFLALLALGFAFEGIWYAARRTTAVTSKTTTRSA